MLCCVLITHFPQFVDKTRIHVMRLEKDQNDTGLLGLTASYCNRFRVGNRVMKYNNKAGLMAERAQNLQDTFLNHVRKTKTPLTIFLVNGVKLQGVVTGLIIFACCCGRDGHSQLVYKHAISTIMPNGPLSLFEAGENTEKSEG